jgi:hypothetical protein
MVLRVAGALSSYLQVRGISLTAALTRPFRRAPPLETPMLRSHATLSAVAVAGFAAFPAFAAPATAQAAPHYHVVKTIQLGHTRADYLNLDVSGRRLYGLGNKVIDVDNDSIIGTVEGGGGGYAIAHDLNRGLVRNGTVFNLQTLAVEGHVDAHGDGIRYDPVTHKAFTWEGEHAWEVDMRTGKLIGTTPIGDGLESGVADGRGYFFLNVEDSGFVERMNTRTYKIGPVYKIAGCGRAQGLSMDTETRRLFMACDTDVMIVDADNGKVVQKISVASRADMNCFDPVAKLAFNPHRADSTVTVIHEDSPNKFSVVGVFPTGGGARTCAVDSRTHKLYVFYYEGTSRENYQLVAAVLKP